MFFAARNLDKEFPPVKPPVSWRRMWGLHSCGKSDNVGIPGIDHDVLYGFWCPVPPAGYVAVGCIFRRTGCGCESDYPADGSGPPPRDVDGLVSLECLVRLSMGRHFADSQRGGHGLEMF